MAFPIRSIALLAISIMAFKSGRAQMILEELSAGHRKTGFNHILRTELGEDDRYTLNGFGFFYKYYSQEDHVYDELGVQVGLFRDIAGGLEGGVAFHHNSIIGLQKKISLQYTIAQKPFFILVRPSLVHVNGKWNEMVFMNAQAHEPISENIGLFGQFRFQMFWGPSMHNLRSFQRIRLGLSVCDAIKLGASVDLDQFKGPEQRERTRNYGLFLQKRL